MAGEPEKKPKVNVEIIGNWVRPNEQDAGFVTRAGLTLTAVASEAELVRKKPPERATV